MHILSKATLRTFWEKYPAAELPLRTWFKDVSAANWATPNDVKAQYGTASIIANNRLVFNIKGNDFRLIVKINYEFSVIYIRFVGTHTEYDHINAATI
jgi:mRNA interferase HigB